MKPSIRTALHNEGVKSSDPIAFKIARLEHHLWARPINPHADEIEQEIARLYAELQRKKGKP